MVRYINYRFPIFHPPITLYYSGTGSLSENTVDVCQGIVFPNSITYQLSISATPEACTQLADRLPLTAQLQFIGFGSVDVNISLLCDCNCDAPVSRCLSYNVM